MNNYKITWMQSGYTNTRLVSALDVVQAVYNNGINPTEVISVQLIEASCVEDNTLKS